MPSVRADLQDEAYRRLLCHWIVPNTQQGPSASPFLGLMTPVSMVSWPQHVQLCTGNACAPDSLSSYLLMSSPVS